MAKDNFPACLAFTLKYEGGKSDDPRDPGGRTNQGVIQRTYDAYRTSKGQSHRDVYQMAPYERDEIYRRDYWGKVTGDSLPAGVDLCVFDFGVNSGPARALRVYASAGHGKTVGNSIHAICGARLSFLRALRTWVTFGRGWATRVSACETRALAMAGASLEDARDKLQKKKRGAAMQATAGVGVILAAIVKSLGAHWGWTLAIIVLGSVAILYFIGKNRAVGVRINVLSDVIADIKAKRIAFEATTKAAESQVGAEIEDLAKKQQEAEAAQAVIDEIGLKPVAAQIIEPGFKPPEKK
jgi:lysozyme family protein